MFDWFFPSWGQALGDEWKFGGIGYLYGSIGHQLQRVVERVNRNSLEQSSADEIIPAGR
jgi:hypothetical protein